MGVRLDGLNSVTIDGKIGLGNQIVVSNAFASTILTPSGTGSRTTGNEFGYTTSVDGITAIVGSPYQNTDVNGANSISNSGAAWILNRTASGWVVGQKLTAQYDSAGRKPNANFGYSVDISGNYLIIGAPGINAAYVFTLVGTTWTFQQKLIPSDVQSGDNFGWSVTIYNGIAIVSSPNQSTDTLGNTAEANSGASYVFTLSGTNWTQTQKICGYYDVRAIGDKLGTSISGDNGILCIGAPYQSFGSGGETFPQYQKNSGAVYAFSWSGTNWVFESKITQPTRTQNENFGSVISYKNNTLIVGCPTDTTDINGANTIVGAGATYTFIRTDVTVPTWSFQQKITQPARTVNTNFGQLISYDGTTLAIGSIGNIDIYYYTTTWTHQQALSLPPIQNTTTPYGYSFNVNDSLLIVGDPFEKGDINNLNPLTNAGAAYVYQKDSNNNWNYLQKIVAWGQDRNINDSLGSTISFDSTTGNLAVSAINHAYDANGLHYMPGAGAVYIWNWNGTTWTFIQKITCSERNAYNENFGSIVQISNDKLFVTKQNPGTVTCLMNFEGLTLTDSSGYNGYYSYSSTATLSTTKFKYGSSSLYLSSATNTTITTTNPSSFNMTGDFTIEFWINTTAISAEIIRLWDAGTTTSKYIIIGLNTLGKIVYNTITSTVAVNDGAWHHVALSRTGTSTTLYIDGVSSATMTDTIAYSTSNVYEVSINSPKTFTGYIDNLCITKNIGKYQTTFTPCQATLTIPTHHMYFYQNVNLIWTEQQQYTETTVNVLPTTNIQYDMFGLLPNGIVFDGYGNNLVVAAPYHCYDVNDINFMPTNPGAVFVYNIVSNAWKRTIKLTSPSRSLSLNPSSFGSSVSFINNWILVGAKNDSYDINNNNYQAMAGSAYIFELLNGTWTYIQKLIGDGNDRNLNDQFGYTVTGYGTTLIVSSPNHCYDSAGLNYKPNAGAIYVWSWNGTGWTFNQKLTPSVRWAGANFGSMISTDGTTTIVAKANDSNNETFYLPFDGSNNSTTITEAWGNTVTNSGVMLSTSISQYGTASAFFSGSAYLTLPQIALLTNDFTVEMWIQFPSISFSGTTNILYYGSNAFLQYNSTSQVLIFGGNNVSFTPTSGTWYHIALSRYNGMDNYFINGTNVLTVQNTTSFASNTLYVGNYLSSGSVTYYMDDFVLTNGEAKYTTNFTPTQHIQCSHKFFVFGINNGTWTQQSYFAPSGINAFVKNTVYSQISINGNNIGISEPTHQYDINGANPLTNAGAVWMFEQNTPGVWTQQQKLVAPVRTTNGYFGNSISVQGNICVVGEPNNSTDNQNLNPMAATGAVWIFKLISNVWTNIQKVVADNTDRETGDMFANGIAISGYTLAVGSPGSSYDNTNENYAAQAGAVYMYTWNGTNWSFNQKITCSERFGDDNFGTNVALSGNNLAVVKKSVETLQPNMMLNFEGSAITDSSIYNNTFTGTATISTSKFKYGTSSLYLSGSTSLQQSSPLNNFAGDFTIELWFNQTNPGYILNIPYSKLSDTSIAIVAGVTSISCYVGYSVSPIVCTATTNDGNWHNVSICRIAGVVYVYIDGNIQGTLNYSANITFFGGLTIGAMSNSTQFFSGYIDNLRIINGVGLYNENYTPSQAGTFNNHDMYFYQKQAGTWVEIQQYNENISTTDGYGYTMNMDGNTLIVSAPYHGLDSNNTNSLSNAGAVWIYTLSGTTWTLQQKLSAPSNSRTANDYMGISSWLEGNTIVVGAYQDSTDATGQPGDTGITTNSGAAYIWVRTGTTWNFMNKIVTEKMDRNINDQFGYAVAAEGTTLVVGARLQDYDPNSTNFELDAGAVYVYNWNGSGWIYTQKIVPSTRNPGDQFGYCVGVSNGVIAVGSPYNDGTTVSTSISGSGSIFTFTQSNGIWTQTQQIVPTGTNARNGTDYFGSTFAINGNTLVVGVPTHNYDASGANSLAQAGAIFIFTNSGTWSQTQKIVATGNNARNSGDQFGYSVGIYQNTIIVGSPYHSYDIDGLNPYTNSGAVWVYSLSGSTWSLQEKVVGWGQARYATDEHGYSMAGSNTYLAVGAINHCYDSTLEVSGRYANRNYVHNAGAVYIWSWSNNTWNFDQKLVPTGTNARNTGDQFGYAVALDGTTCAVSSIMHQYDSTGANPIPEAGAVWVYERTATGFLPWVQVAKLTPTETNGRNKYDRFGMSLAVDGTNNRVAVGTPYHAYDSAGSDPRAAAGAVWTFSKVSGSYTQMSKLVDRTCVNFDGAPVGNGLLCWFDLADLTSMTYTSTNVNTVQTKNGSHYSLTTNSTISPNMINGNFAISLSNNTTINDPDLNTMNEMTIFLVVDFSKYTYNISDPYIYFGQNGTTGNYWSLYVQNNNTLFISNSTTMLDGVLVALPNIAELNSWSVISITTSTTIQNTQVWNYGVPAFIGTFGSDHPLNVQLAGSINPGNMYSSNLGEILVYDRILTTIERETIEGYLTTKWSPYPFVIDNSVILLPSNLPVNVQLSTTSQSEILSFAIVVGVLPFGLDMSLTGLITGTTPYASIPFNDTVTIRATNANGQYCDDQILFTVYPSTDIYWNFVASLMHFDDNITDSVAYNTWNIGSNQIVNSFFQLGTGSLYCLGTSSTTSTSRNWNPGSADFTVEFWMNYISGTDVANICDITGKSPWRIYVSGGNIIFQTGTTNYTLGTAQIGLWINIAISRIGGNIYGFYNGTLSFTYNVGIGTALYNSGTVALSLGGQTSGNYFTGYIDEFRYTIGIGRYSTTFTPNSFEFQDGPSFASQEQIIYYPSNTAINSTIAAVNSTVYTPLTYSVSFGSLPGNSTQNTTSGLITGTSPTTTTSNIINTATITATNQAGSPGSEIVTFVTYPTKDQYISGVSMNVHFDGTNGSSTITDTINGAMTISGTVTLNTTTCKYGTASGYFNNGFAYLNNNSKFLFASSDFTLECWINLNSSAGTQTIFASNTLTSLDYQGVLFTFSGNALNFYLGNGTAWSYSLSSPTGVVSLNTWMHIAAVRQSQNMFIYVNGVLVASGTTGSSVFPIITPGSNTFGIGGRTVSSQNIISGYIDDARVTLVARYVPNFIVPTTPFTADSSTVSLIPFTDTSTDLINGTLSFYGPSITNSSSVTKINSTSAKFIGTGFVYLNNYSNLLFDFNDFTIECWINSTSVSGTQTIIASNSFMASDFDGVWFGLVGNQIVFKMGNGSSWVYTLISPLSIVTGTWYHIAAVRQGTNVFVYVNGVLEISLNTGYVYGIPTPSSNTFGIGGRVLHNEYFNGYIDEVRISNGLARYSSNYYLAPIANPNN